MVNIFNGLDGLLMGVIGTICGATAVFTEVFASCTQFISTAIPDTVMAVSCVQISQSIKSRPVLTDETDVTATCWQARLDSIRVYYRCLRALAILFRPAGFPLSLWEHPCLGVLVLLSVCLEVGLQRDQVGCSMPVAFSDALETTTCRHNEEKSKFDAQPSLYKYLCNDSP